MCKKGSKKWKDLDSIKKEFYKRFPNSKLILLEFTDNLVKIKDSYGFCLYSIQHILHEGTSSILNAINKTDYFINQAKEIHGNKYDYSKVDYIKSKRLVVIICPIHGEFSIKPLKHLFNQGCKKCGNLKTADKNNSNTEKFIEKANTIHNFKYDYSLVEYKKAIEKVTIICFKHGEFRQQPNCHLNGSGCVKCKNQLTSDRNKENPTGWTYTNWQKCAKKSKNFDGFKVYVVKCKNDTEEFYKIGKTFTTVKERFNNKKSLPYSYEVVQIFEGSANNMSKLEEKLKNSNKNNKYLPKIKFNGMYECFTKIENYEEFLVKE